MSSPEIPPTHDTTNLEVPRPTRRQHIVMALRLIAGVAILWFLVSRIDIRESFDNISTADPLFCIAAFCSFGAARLSESVRLFSLLPDQLTRFRNVIRVTIISTFFNNFSTPFLGDGYRAMALWKWLKDVEKSLTIIVIDRLLGILSICMLGGTYLLVFRTKIERLISNENIKIQTTTQGVMLAIFVFIAGVCVVLFLKRRFQDVHERVDRFIRAVRNISGSKFTLAFLATVMAQILVASMTFFLVIAFGGSLSFVDTLAVMLLVYVAGYIPISVGSLGVREGVMFLGLASFGVPQTVAVSVAITARLMMYAYAVGGGVWFFSTRQKKT